MKNIASCSSQRASNRQNRRTKVLERATMTVALLTMGTSSACSGADIEPSENSRNIHGVLEYGFPKGIDYSLGSSGVYFTSIYDSGQCIPLAHGWLGRKIPYHDQFGPITPYGVRSTQYLSVATSAVIGDLQVLSRHHPKFVIPIELICPTKPLQSPKPSIQIYVERTDAGFRDRWQILNRDKISYSYERTGCNIGVRAMGGKISGTFLVVRAETGETIFDQPTNIECVVRGTIASLGAVGIFKMPPQKVLQHPNVPPKLSVNGVSSLPIENTGAADYLALNLSPGTSRAEAYAIAQRKYNNAAKGTDK